MEKDLMLTKLHKCKPYELPPIFVPSYNRPEFVSARILNTFTPEARERIFIVTRWEQRKAYRKANPKLNILPISKDYEINGLASTRQFIFEYAAAHRIPRIIDMDDDITYLSFLFDGVSANTGQPYSKHSIKADREADPLLDQRILTLAGSIARQVYKRHPNTYLGNIRRQRMSQAAPNAKLKYIVNKGPTPRQVTFVNVRGLYEADINRDMCFDPHGDDIGFCAVILKHHGNLFNIPCLTYDYVSEKCDSVIRTPETSKQLHKYEYYQLMKYPIRDYLRTSFRDEDGDYMWGDINWQAYHKKYNTEPIQCFWKENK